MNHLNKSKNNLKEMTLYLQATMWKIAAGMCLLFFLTANSAWGQSISFDWAKSIGDASGASGSAIAVDAAGNVYVGGSFNGKTDFDPGSDTAFLTPNGGSDIFIAKYNANGQYIWAHKIGGTGSDGLKKVIADDAGHIYFTGTFNATADFNPAGGGTLISNGGTDVFVAKFDTAGNYIWAKQAGGTGGGELVNGMGIDKSGGVYITGAFTGTIFFGGSGGAVPGVTAAGQDAFIARYDANGNIIWGKNIGGANTDEGMAIRTDDSGNVYTTGRFQGNVNFNTTPGETPAYLISVGGGLDIYVAKYNAAGEYIWAFSVGGATGSDLPKDLVLEQATGHVWVVGQFAGTADFDPGTPVVNLGNTGSDVAGFIAKYDRDGNYLLARNIGGTNGTFFHISTMALNAAGDIYITGFFAGQVDFDPGTLVVNHTSGSLFQDAFFAKYDVGLNHVWSAPVLGTGSITDGIGVTTAGDGKIYFTGTYAGKANFGPGPGDTLSSGGDWLNKIYMAKFSDTCPSFNVLNVTACDRFIFDGHTYTATGVYTKIFTGAHCDSVVTLNLTIKPAPVATVIKNESELTANNAESYQWINCADNTVIPGATDQQYTATANGSYAVILTNNGCSDTSDCITAGTDLGVHEAASGNIAKLYPNPTDGSISIQTGEALGNATIRVMNTIGQVLQEHTKQQGNLFRISLEGYRTGIYFVEIADNTSRMSMRVIKE